MLLLLDESKTEFLTELLTSVLIAPPSFTPTVNVTAGGAGGGSLQAGNYFCKITYVTANGETTCGPESAQFTVSTGNQPQLTNIPSPLPGGVQTVNIYLTAAGGSTGTETRYKTGVTANANSTMSGAQSTGAGQPGSNTATWPPTITLRLYTNNLAYAETHTYSSYTELSSITYPWYSAVALSRGTGGSPWTLTSGSPTSGWAPTDQSANVTVAEATTAQQSWNDNAGASTTIYGYYYSVLNLAASNIALGSETFASPITLTNPSTLNLTPRIGVAAA